MRSGGSSVAASSGRRGLLVLAVVSAVVASGCSSGSARPTLRYVALGDSYSSGEGNPPFDAGTDVASGPNQDRCRRSRVAFPHQLHVRANLVLVHRACSGAVGADVTTTSKYPPEPPQVSWVDASTNLVTITIGGNEAGFGTVLVSCLLELPSCSVTDPGLDTRITALAQSLPPVFAAIRQRSPAARILVVGYPDIFPPVPATGAAPCARLRILGRGLTGTEITTLRARAHHLDQVIADAAATAGVEYVDAESAFAGHEVCTSQPWVYGLDLTNHGSLHPNASGQAALGAKVSAAFDRRG